MWTAAGIVRRTGDMRAALGQLRDMYIDIRALRKEHGVAPQLQELLNLVTGQRSCVTLENSAVFFSPANEQRPSVHKICILMAAASMTDAILLHDCFALIKRLVSRVLCTICYRGPPLSYAWISHVQLPVGHA